MRLSGGHGVLVAVVGLAVGHGALGVTGPDASAGGPVRASGAGTTLLDVVALAPDDAWAVGYSRLHPEDGPDGRAVVMHWDGAAWARVTVPKPGLSSWLESVTATGPDDVWAAGVYRKANGSYLGLVEHWDGVSWSIVLRDEHRNEFSAIDAYSSDDVWAVSHERVLAGQGDFAHWDGPSWNIIQPPDIGFLSFLLP